jgi:threonine/homoserine/homoserine lactone efflux protein
MALLTFVLETVLISLSGVMAPGPITAVAVGKGSESPHAGALVAVGHGIVEFPLIAIVYWGFGYLANASYAHVIIAFVGGALLLLMGIDMLRKVRSLELGARRGVRSPVVAGILLSIGNPYFLIWWVTVGAALIARSLQFGIWGVVILAIAHWSCDLSWSYLLSAVSFRGGRLLGRRFQEAVFVLCGIFLVFFGGKYIVDAVRVFVA